MSSQFKFKGCVCLLGITICRFNSTIRTYYNKNRCWFPIHMLVAYSNFALLKLDDSSSSVPRAHSDFLLLIWLFFFASWSFYDPECKHSQDPDATNCAEPQASPTCATPSSAVLLLLWRRRRSSRCKEKHSLSKAWWQLRLREGEDSCCYADISLCCSFPLLH